MIGGSNIVKGSINEIYCDDATDIQDLADFAEEWDLKIGSTCVVVDTGQVLMMKSDYSWNEL